MNLYSFFNSSASYRVRIAMALKGIDYQTVGVNIRIGQQNALEYRRLNPVGLVPALITDEGESLGQSLAIIDWLDRHFPQTPLLPAKDPQRMRVLEVVYAISCDIHPINNMRVLRYLSDELKVSEEEKKRWYAHWIQQGLSAVEQLLRRGQSGAFCFGDAPTLADCCLVPQWANAERMGCDLSGFPRCKAVYDACTALPAFIAAAPENQQDKIPA
ncbi:TPA: maleylacetoacetate isomerase [Kluyvera ascorbata]|nr:maleylacetoacetate isomerase [Klebsiella sp. STW0522-44]HAT7515709.1 maleylacetoacetate isomerase [Kluyvera ascorbata]HCL5620976.1 maleylacetoacetate isomerase [Kluyvera ascorbata]HED3202518.1 maleylacetoacetate isomerase [Kluyvera ascorbata]HED4086814.1 maleylacetoacetate isomerase [Kluyvera ascorbata]